MAKPVQVPVQVHLFAAARAAAGRSELAVEPGTLGQVLDRAVDQCPGLVAVLPRCSYLLDEVSVTGTDTPVPAGSRLDVLPPFAGG